MQSDFRTDLLHHYSEAELCRFIRASLPIQPFSVVFQLSPSLLAKHYEPAEFEDMLRATETARQLSIHVPYIERTVMYDGNLYCIMRRIQGNTLEEIWTQLSWFVSIKLALQLRRYIKRLRSITSLTAGSLVTGECRSFWLEDRFGLPPRSTAESIASFLQFWTNFTSIRKEVAAYRSSLAEHARIRISPVVVKKDFVLTHHDLAPRNIILDSSGRLWLLDWDYAGFYPVYFEYASMHNFNIPQDWNSFTVFRWNLFCWVAAGRYKQEQRLLTQIRSKFIRFAAGRRFQLLKKGGPSRRPVS